MDDHNMHDHNMANAASPAIDHDALLQAQTAETQRQAEAIDRFTQNLKDMIIWEPFLLDHTIDDLELVTKTTISELERLAYRPRTPPPPSARCIHPTNNGPHVQSAAVRRLTLASIQGPRTLFLRLKRSLANIDEFLSAVIPARIESVYWNEAGKYVFVNFLDARGATAYADYMRYHPAHVYHWEVKSTLLNAEVRELGAALAEAVVVNGATRILRLEGVPAAYGYGRAWRVADGGGHPRFKHALRIREGHREWDFALEFEDVGRAIAARERLAAQKELGGVGFSWMANEMDRKVEEFTEELNGVLTPVKIQL